MCHVGSIAAYGIVKCYRRGFGAALPLIVTSVPALLPVFPLPYA